MLKLMTCKRIAYDGLYDAYVSDGGIINVSPASGGFAVASFMTQKEFLSQFVEAEPGLTLRKGRVTYEFLPGEEFPCFAYQMLWNGFGMPLFESATANQLAQMFTAEAVAGTPSSLRLADGILEEYDWSDLVYRPCPVSDHVVDGQTYRLWVIGDGWAWDAVEFD